MPIKIIFLDDHAYITEIYKKLIENTDVIENYFIECLHTLKQCYKTIFIERNIPDVIFIDISMPGYLEENINDGFDLALRIRIKLPMVKIVFLTMHTSELYLYSIIEKVQPEGFLIKSDIDASAITEALEKAISGNLYYSNTVIKAVKNISQFVFCNDELNRNILLLTSKRYTNKEISEQLKVSESTIEKRKTVIKQHLGIEKQNDRNMIEFLNNLRFF